MKVLVKQRSRSPSLMAVVVGLMVMVLEVWGVWPVKLVMRVGEF